MRNIHNNRLQFLQFTSNTITIITYRLINAVSVSVILFASGARAVLRGAAAVIGLSVLFRRTVRMFAIYLKETAPLAQTFQERWFQENCVRWLCTIATDNNSQ